MSTKEKIIKAIDTLPEEKLKEVEANLETLLHKSKKVSKLTPRNLDGKYDDKNVREVAYPKIGH